MATDWTVPRHAAGCRACNHPFSPEETFQVFLYETPAGYERRDYCAACRPEDASVALGTWRTRMPPQQQPKRAPMLDRAELLALLEQLAPQRDSGRRRLRFALALLLWRKRALKFARAQQAADGEYWEFDITGTGATCSVWRPELDDAALDALSIELEALITGRAAEPTLTLVTSRGGSENDAHGSTAGAGL